MIAKPRVNKSHNVIVKSLAVHVFNTYVSVLEVLTFISGAELPPRTTPTGANGSQEEVTSQDQD